MAEWLYEAGIGEARAALVRDGAILRARIELDDGAPRPGAIMPARLSGIVVRGREGIVALDGGGEALLSPLPATLTQGSALLVTITRAPIHEPGRAKRARAAPAPPGSAPAAAADLRARLAASGFPVRICLPHEPDRLEAAGWSEVLEEARGGEIGFAGGALRMTPTPAMTLFDVDGSGPLEPLAIAAAGAIGRAIVRHDIGGASGIDFPTLAGKAARRAVAEAIDAALAAGAAGPFERTAMNGFGFLQIVRRRTRASLPELLRADPAAAEARALLRRLERIPPPAPRHQRVPRRVHAALAAQPGWLAELARRTGADICLTEE